MTLLCESSSNTPNFTVVGAPTQLVVHQRSGVSHNPRKLPRGHRYAVASRVS